jgi:hypothetical protein
MYILSGRLSVVSHHAETDDKVEEKRMGPNDFVFVPIMEPHNIRNLSDTESASASARTGIRLVETLGSGLCSRPRLGFPATVRPDPLVGMLTDEFFEPLREVDHQTFHFFFSGGPPIRIQRGVKGEQMAMPLPNVPHHQDRGSTGQSQKSGTHGGIGRLSEEVYEDASDPSNVLIRDNSQELVSLKASDHGTHRNITIDRLNPHFFSHLDEFLI